MASSQPIRAVLCLTWLLTESLKQQTCRCCLWACQGSANKQSTTKSLCGDTKPFYWASQSLAVIALRICPLCSHPLWGCQENGQIFVPWFKGAPREALGVCLSGFGPRTVFWVTLQASLLAVPAGRELWDVHRWMAASRHRNCWGWILCLLLGCCPPAARMMHAWSSWGRHLIPALGNTLGPTCHEVKGFLCCHLGEDTFMMNLFSGQTVQLFLLVRESLLIMNLFCCSSPSGQVMMQSIETVVSHSPEVVWMLKGLCWALVLGNCLCHSASSRYNKHCT